MIAPSCGAAYPPRQALSLAWRMTPPSPESVPPEILARRRLGAARRLGEGVLVLPASPVQHGSRDSERPYIADRELHYLTGLVEPESVAVLVGGAEPRLVVFVRERDADAELWAGPRMGPEGALAVSGADEVHPVSALERILPTLLRAADRIHFRLGRADPGTAMARGGSSIPGKRWTIFGSSRTSTRSTC